MDFEIKNYSDEFNLDKYRELITRLVEYTCEQLQVSDEPIEKIVFIKDLENAQNPLGKTAYYLPSEETVVVYATDRHIKDMMRSIAHEIVHHKQKKDGQFPGNKDASRETGYALYDKDLRELEREAFETGNMIFRTFEDKLKTEKVEDQKMKRLSQRLRDKFGFGLEA